MSNFENVREDIREMGLDFGYGLNGVSHVIVHNHDEQDEVEQLCGGLDEEVIIVFDDEYATCEACHKVIRTYPTNQEPIEAVVSGYNMLCPLCLDEVDSEVYHALIYDHDIYIEDMDKALTCGTSYTDDDFYIDVDGMEFRFISKDAIDELWEEGLIEMVKDCYGLSDVPSFVTIDWAETIENLKEDGMGHHFGSYDGEEYETDSFYYFRTN